MNEIVEKIRNTGVTKKDWCAKHRVNVQYLGQIIKGTRGKSDLGETKRIKDLLKADGICLEEKRGHGDLK